MAAEAVKFFFSSIGPKRKVARLLLWGLSKFRLSRLKNKYLIP